MKMLKKLFIASAFAAIACCESASALEIKNPGILVKLTPAAKSYARKLYSDCKNIQSIRAGSMPPKAAKAYLNAVENFCVCQANAIGNVWEEYGRNDLAASLALLRVDHDGIIDTCIAKYIKPYFKD